jgi:ADP-heptose:LPS heptosyltransferase
LLGVNESSIPRDVPYLFADPERVARWQPHVAALPGFKVGIGWQGNPAYRFDEYRSIPLAHFAPLAQLPGVTLVRLQKGAGEEQIAPNRHDVPMCELGELDRDGVFVDTAAILQHLDLVITSDTALAHLAGALGRPVWMLVSTDSAWRWLEKRSDSPWYPTMRIFRQRSLGDWPGVFQEVTEALRSEVAARGSRR